MRFTLTETAQQLRKSRRWLLGWLRTHPLDSRGKPFFTQLGRDKIFSESDIVRIEETCREEFRRRVAPIFRPPRRARPRDLATEQAFEEARRLFAEGRTKRRRDD